jgi:hypothetical protein
MIEMYKSIGKIIILVMLNSYNMESQDVSLTSLMPGNLKGWEAEGNDRLYGPTNLYDYIDGGAELYLSFGMKEVLSRRYHNEGTSEISVEIFDMINSENAFGVFTHTRTTNENIYGQGSQYFTGAQIFWKDKYFVTVTSNSVNDEIKRCILDLSSEIDHRITSTGKLPKIIEYLPFQSQLNDDYVYFHHYIWQNSYYFISNENIFNINDSAQAVIARYGKKNDRYFLLLVDYNDSDKANKALMAFSNTDLHNNDNMQSRESKDKKWCDCLQKNGILICVLNARNKKTAQELIDETLNLIISQTKK